MAQFIPATSLRTFEMAAAADGNTHWATQESQWEAHRETIGWLYCKQDKTLAEVMEIMRREHGFRARYVSSVPQPHYPPRIISCGFFLFFFSLFFSFPK